LADTKASKPTGDKNAPNPGGNAGPDPVGQVSFSVGEVSLIAQSLPAQANPRRLTMLPLILAEWGRTDLPEYFGQEPTPERATRNARLKSVAAKSGKLAHALRTLTPMDLDFIAFALSQDRQPTANPPRRYDVMQSEIAEITGVIATLETISEGATAAVHVGRRGQPMNLKSHLVLRDLAAIYQYVTGKPATRSTDRETGRGSGPFWEFAKAVWPVVFENADDGLSAALKVWAGNPSKASESSALLANIDLRHPEWGIFGP